MDCVIEAADVWKMFRLYHDRAPTLKEQVLFSHRRKYDELWVLKGVDLKVEKGRTLGLIGQNGSGKSTFLKLLTRIIYPDRGNVKIKGKVSSLLELGAGFHPDFSGLENIYMNAAIFGLTKKEIDRRLEEIIDFSELEEFIDSPVRTYSSGMYMRLAFSIAINVDPDILLVDEILAVGDEGFQKKCFNKMKSFKSQGATIVIVSHSLGQLEMLCDELAWLHEGVLLEQGVPADVIGKYRTEVFAAEDRRAETKSRLQAEHVREEATPDPERNSLDDPEEGDIPIEITPPKRRGNGSVEITGVAFMDRSGRGKTRFESGEPCVIEMRCHKHKPVDNLVFGIAIYRNDDLWCYGTNTLIDRQPTDVQIMGDGIVVRVNIAKLNLVEGEYYLNVACSDGLATEYDYLVRCLDFTVYSQIKDVGVCRLEHRWEISGLNDRGAAVAAER
ncbi:Putative ABC transporter [Acididesulfobacillus acetoxydans]|uniref:ABC transporter n=1 Tax=Acididesulfobacillus acetoxydans TaxID=1561005 RepID=A0A8S0WDU9_9FIRM|nr:ABC transporter ATP-binding protein [Acididesulfobacillus acetoxydans]CAA7599572.1 Putative ABC transporter [Acididesulfobacillus acetoxydans]CEJ07767.1 O-antigen export system ATP-binding protein RfbB [Acididesulfobacillus acetoxydans]